MKKKVFLVIKAEITTYPPILTIINHIIEIGMTPVVIGVFNQEETRQYYQNQGMEYIPTVEYNPKGNLIRKVIQQLIYRKQLKKALKKNYQEGDYVWIFNLETMMLLDSIVKRYITILHFFEFVGNSFNWKYRLFYPTYSMKKTVSKAYKIIHCEYNRAQISRGLYSMRTCPIILPNKPLLQDEIFENIPKWIEQRINGLKSRISGKRIILYQGAFTDGERRLDEFCDAIQMLSNEYALVAMGKETAYSKKLKTKYDSDRIIFEDYLPAPFHLLVTEIANIGILTYFPLSNKMADVINPIYCAPNKIFEYARFGIPMIGNDIPGLKYPFEENNCGLVIQTPLKPEDIASTITIINNNYNNYSQGARNLYNSVNTLNIVRNILS